MLVPEVGDKVPFSALSVGAAVAGAKVSAGAGVVSDAAGATVVSDAVGGAVVSGGIGARVTVMRDGGTVIGKPDMVGPIIGITESRIEGKPGVGAMGEKDPQSEVH